MSRPYQHTDDELGFAVWIGNLPPKTELFDLVNYVCLRTVGVESIFFISKSNCAFANFKEEQQSVDAQQLLHACQFRNARLVCRLQPANDAYKGAAASAELEPESPAIGHCKLPLGAAVSAPQSQNRFFILKSLTLEYLQRSVTTGIWATQTQNEQILAEAYEVCHLPRLQPTRQRRLTQRQTTENVYLIFSANKSGEYFGYARMISQINQDPRATIEFAPQEQTPTERNEPRPVPVEANGNRPMGHVIHRSDRGTLFWQVVRDSKDDDDDNDNDDVENTQTGAADDETQTRGKPFHLAWLSSSRLPFYRTRGLRNPWNSNREVKVARDGTELEPSVGKTLISLFNRNYSLGGSVPESA